MPRYLRSELIISTTAGWKKNSLTRLENMKSSIALSGICLAMAITFLTILYLGTKTPTASATGPFYTNIGYTATSSAAVAVTTSTRIAATTTSPTDPANGFTRVYATICNTSVTPVAILLNGDRPVNASTGGATAFIAAAAGYNSCFTIDDKNTYNGSITASSTTQGSVTVNVTQYVQ